MTAAQGTRFKLRLADSNDIPKLVQIEIASTAKFKSIPALADLVETESLPAAKVHQWLADGRIFAVTDNGEIVGFAASYPMDGAPYLAEISVANEVNGQGAGSMLMNAVFDYAREVARAKDKAPTLTLTTYPDVPWNGPFYRKRGFREVDAEELGPDHVRKMTLDKDERNLVRPGWRRCCMIWEGRTN